MLNAAVRIFQRYIIPQFIVSIYYFIFDHSFISLKANVQLTRKISFGKGSIVRPFSVILTTNAKIKFGKNCSVGNFVVIGAHDADIIIGDNSRIAHNIVIASSTRKYRNKNRLIVDQGWTSKRIIIGNDVWIASGAIISAGCSIGDGAFITGGSVLNNQTVPPYSIVAGVPGRVIGKRS
jgi:acetyltransferase-like isoleucine patch superfamily enzyme